MRLGPKPHGSSTVINLFLDLQRGRGNFAVHYTSLQSFKITFFLFVGLTTLQTFTYWILISWFIRLRVQTFQPIIIFYRRDNFVYCHWGCKSIYWLLCYPFRSLTISCLRRVSLLTISKYCMKSTIFFLYRRKGSNIPRNNSFRNVQICYQCL